MIRQAEIQSRGRSILVPAAEIDGRTVISTRGWLRIASVIDEELTEGEVVADPESFVYKLKQSGLKADLLTFPQKPTDPEPKYGYRMEWDNLAVVPITTYSDWWTKQTDPGVRRGVRKAAKSGVTVEEVEFSDEFVQGIVNIHNETPVRQGKAFWHYRQSFDGVKRDYSTYASRNIFLGAYWEDELIGFLRMTRVDNAGSIIQILSMMKHYDKRPANALIAKAVQVCETRGLSHLIYCNYAYNEVESSLTEFKRRNGFEKFLIPRYYIPLSATGAVAVRLRLYRSPVQRIPKPILLRLLKVRRGWHMRKLKANEGVI